MEKKVYLEENEIKQLKLKAEALGFTDRGWLSNFLRFLSKEEFILMDDNVKRLLSAMKLKV